MSSNWLAVASAEHVRLGKQSGFMQVCHGKEAPLRRVRPGDRVVYYSPTEIFKGREKLQAFTAIGIAKDEEPYRMEMGGGFFPFRRSMQWLKADQAPIRPLLQKLELSAGKANWGYALRSGLISIGDRDLATIAEAMHCAFFQEALVTGASSATETDEASADA